MNNLVGIVFIFCFILIGCGKDEERECAIENFSDVDFRNLNISSRFTKAIQSESELIILSNFPDVTLTSLDPLSFFPLWSNVYRSNIEVGANDFILSSDDNIIIAGIKRQTSTGTLNTWILECNENELSINEIENISESTNITNEIYELDNGDLICLGRNQSQNSTLTSDVHIKNIAADGSLIWEREFDEGINDEGVEIMLLENENLLLCYTWSGNLLLNKGIGLIEIDLFGNVIRNKRFETHSESLYDDVIFRKTTSGKIIVTSSFQPDLSLNSFDPIVFIINSEFEIEWSSQNKSENSSQLLHDITELSNGDFLIAGSSGGECFEGTNLYLSRVTSNGTLLWQHTYGDNLTNNIGKYIVEHENGEIIILCDQYEKDEQLKSTIVFALIDQNGNPI